MKKALWLIFSFLSGLILFGCKFPDYTDPYLTNPNFELLLKRGQSHHWLFSPFLSPDGERLYYIEDTIFYPCSHTWPPPLQEAGWIQGILQGNVYVYSISEKSERCLFSGNAVDLDLSRDGMRLLIEAWNPNHKAHYALLIETSGTFIESIPLPTSTFCGISLNGNGDGMFWASVEWNPLYRAYHTYLYFKRFWGDTATILVYAIPTIGFFDIFHNDSFYYIQNYSPAVNPVESRWVIYPEDHWKVWRCYDRSTKRSINLGRESKPYLYCYVGWQNWSVDGKDLIFSCAQTSYTELEIWRLKNAIEVVKDAFQKEGRK